MFTDEVKEERVGAWLVRKVDYENEDKTRVARYVKTHPHTLLSNYDATLWLDASIEILTSFVYERCVELLEKGVQLASIQHPWRDCIYDEAYVVYGLEEERKIMDWCHRLRKEGYPRHNGLYEANSTNVRIHIHNNRARTAGRRGIKETFWEHARCRCRNGMEEKAEQFREFHYWLYGLNPVVAKILLHLWGVYATLVYGLIIKFRAYKRHKNE